jgi:quinol monooxygenase YgiN
MSVLVHAEIHGLAGYAAELREIVREHAGEMARADGSLGAAAYEPIGAEAGELLLEALWRDEEAMRAHYATPEYARYTEQVEGLLARPSDVRIHYVERTVRPEPDLASDPTRQD